MGLPLSIRGLRWAFPGAAEPFLRVDELDLPKLQPDGQVFLLRYRLNDVPDRLQDVGH